MRCSLPHTSNPMLMPIFDAHCARPITPLPFPQAYFPIPIVSAIAYCPMLLDKRSYEEVYLKKFFNLKKTNIMSYK